MRRRWAPPIRVSHPVHFLAVGFGSGLVPWLPGTFGTLAGIPLYLLIAGLPWPLYLAMTVALFIVGVFLCDKTARDAGVHDHPAIVWDEIVGLLMTLLWAPAGWLWIVAGFVLFRVFDMLKPWPIGLLDRYVKGGFGIMLDDLVAGLFAFAALQLTAWVLHAPSL